jgi:sec-independent protein translocase protein TatA
MFGVGTAEIVVIALIALILFGNRLPQAMRSVGRGISEFKKGVSGADDGLPPIECGEVWERQTSQGDG